MATFQKFDRREHIRRLTDAARQILAEELICQGKMPPLEQVVEAVEETRKKYLPRTSSPGRKHEEQWPQCEVNANDLLH